MAWPKGGSYKEPTIPVSDCQNSRRIWVQVHANRETGCATSSATQSWATDKAKRARKATGRRASERCKRCNSTKASRYVNKTFIVLVEKLWMPFLVAGWEKTHKQKSMTVLAFEEQLFFKINQAMCSFCDVHAVSQKNTARGSLH